jgi:DNA adenine methylase
MKSPIPYIGGKSRLAQTIIKMIPDHKAYCEVFAGAAWVFFTKPPSKFETLNDLDNDLVNFYRVLQHHLEEFLKQFKWMLTSREIFDDFKAQLETPGLTDIQRAARYYYLQRHAFSGLTRTDRKFAGGSTKRPGINLLRMEEELSAVHLRLAHAKIENLDWRDFVHRYDSPDTFFYLDPPYWKRQIYKHNMDPSEYTVMTDVLNDIKGKFLLSIDDRAETREIFDCFKLKPISFRYSAQRVGAKIQGKELLISNY